MEAHCKVIPLKTAMTATYDVLSERLNAGPIDGRESDSLINKALCVPARWRKSGNLTISPRVSGIRYICLPTIWVAGKGLVNKKIIKFNV